MGSSTKACRRTQTRIAEQQEFGSNSLFRLDKFFLKNLHLVNKLHLIYFLFKDAISMLKKNQDSH